MENVDRNMGNFCRAPLWQTTMTAQEVEYMFDNYAADCIICNGHLRQAVVEKITDNRFKVYTKNVLSR